MFKLLPKFRTISVCGWVMLLSATIGGHTWAQTTRDTLIQRDLYVEKEYIPEVSESNKLLLVPDLEPSVLQKQTVIFSQSVSPVSPKGYYLPLSAPTLSSSYPAQGEKGYFNFSGGSHTSFLGEGQVNLIQRPNQVLDLRITHRSIFGDITNPAGEARRSFMNQNRFLASYKIHLPANELKVSLSQQYNAWNYYGSLKTSSATIPSEINTPGSQWLSASEFSLSLNQKNTGQLLHYKLGVTGYLFYLGNGVNAPSATLKTKGGREGSLLLNGSASYAASDYFSILAKASIQKLTYREPATFPVYESYYINQPLTAPMFADQSWINVSTIGQLKQANWLFSGGLNVSVPSLETQKVRWSPLLSARLTLNERTVIHATLDGEVQPFTYRNGFEQNPYLDPFIHLQAAYTPIRVTIGAAIRPTEAMRFNPLVEYERTTNMPLFYNALPSSDVINDTYGRLFSYTPMTVNRLSIGTEAYYNFKSILRFYTEVRYNHYITYSNDAALDIQLAPNRKAWYKPAFVARFRLDASPFNRISVFGDYQITALRYAPTATQFMHQLAPINDLNAGLTWEMARNVQLLFRINNLLDQRYEIWNAYRVHGFTAMMGGSVRF